MPRIARKDLRTNFLHIMVQGVNKEYIFEKDIYIEKFLIILKKYIEQYDITIISYCIMNNHAHILIYVNNIMDLGKLMHKINIIYAQFYNKEKNRCGVVFRNRYQSEPIYDITHLTNCINYIHMNPVKAKMVKKCEEYKYSSYRDYKLNRGICKSKIMEKIYGKNFDFSSLLSKGNNCLFIDVNKPKICEINEMIDIKINEFKKNNDFCLIEILSDRNNLKLLIKYLRNECNFKYVDICNRLDINKSLINKLKE